ncbi:uncharacterized protein K460DRAFT_357212 [Cucurbitaria berberidis CBS 394.84]|uniref:Uncharacterized protein n=1 Tax=Cucurbitaria berberidis CBS 394.84 TaxID=1168544 RepID=A0A9P4GDY4_9PLEO|nr:uncharacterized protein K460DRAFT_357212 [Cucurbitaria berberidis CBS 394.84]KAF1843489.1 hypothetical protein K460DRAFT_357212 [Cucurbitaria berberidis CBS 394.84]
MASTQRDRGGDSWEDNVARIDLTLESSPEPERRPRMPLRQSQLPSYLKREPRQSSMEHIKNEQGQSAGSTRNAPHRHARPINPHHLAQIINTSNSSALRKVLLNLCQLSPALSSAVARGLALHSTYARGVVGTHGVTPGNPSARPSEDDAYNAYERTKKRIAVRNKAIETDRVARRDADRNLHASQPVLLGSGSDIEDAHVPGAFPHSVKQASKPHTPQRDIPRSSTTVNHSPMPLSVSGRLTNVQRENIQKPMICSQCDEQFTDDEDVCIYHPGRTMEQEGSMPTWSCCNAPFSEIGCQFGSHVHSDLSRTIPQDNRPQSQHKLCAQCHQPWVAESLGCRYHSGRKVKRDGGMAVYSCCNKAIDAVGCEYGSHVDPEKRNDPLSHNQPSASESPFPAQRKKPRFL